MLDLGNAVGYLDLDTSGFSKGFSDARQQMQTFFDSTNNASTRLTALGGAATSVGSSMTKYVTTPLLGAGSAALYFADDFNKALGSIEAKTGSTKERMSELEQVLDSVYQNNYGEDYQDIADAISNVDQQLKGLSAESLQYVTEAAFTLRDTMGYEVNESVRAADSLMTNFGITAEQAFDYIAAGAQNGLDWSDELLDTINEYSPQFTKLGLDVEDMFAAFSNGAEEGAWNLDKIGDAMKEFSIRVVDQSDSTTEAFEALGFSADAMAYKFGEGGEAAKEAMFETIQALKDLDDPVQQGIVGVQLFGTMWEDLGAEAIFALTDIKDGAFEADDALKQMQDAQYDNLSSQLETLRRSFVTLGKELGEVLLPKFREIVEWVQNVTNSFVNMSPETQNLVVSIGLFAAALGPVLLVGGKLITGFTKVQAMLPVIQAGIAALSGPIGIVVAAVAAFALAWATDFGGVRDATSEIMNSIKDIILSVWELIKAAWDTNFMGIKTVTEIALDSIKAVFETAFGVIEGLLEVFSAAFKGDWEGVWNGVKDIASSIWNGITELFNNFVDAILTILVNIAYNLYEAARNAFSKILEAFKIVWNYINAWLNVAKEDPVKAILSIVNSMFEAGKSILNSLWDGLKSVWDSIVGWFEGIVDWIKDKLNFVKDSWDSLNDDKDRAEGYSVAIPDEGKRSLLSVYNAENDDLYSPYGSTNVNSGKYETQNSKDIQNLTRAVGVLAKQISDSQKGDLNISMTMNSANVARAIIPDFRRISKQNPEYEGDF